MTPRWDHHPPCPGGCDQLADECACARPNPLGSMRTAPPIGSRTHVPGRGLGADEPTTTNRKA